MHNTKAIETILVESTRVEVGSDRDVFYVITAEVIETGVNYSFIGAHFINNEKSGESTMGRFATLREARKFVENYIAACKIA